uniref:Protein kinase-like domain, concanavalin A-like lectin/glucanase domain protein n=1 Tax=Tanacetum cinerariifolium TaxID=118510 RepID=A0A6L2NCT4_TANCI|nr:protein kinase-like domain, concanavalin A-like lectin/glucanase domain protein [Tanacetum cinerariifolium]
MWSIRVAKVFWNLYLRFHNMLVEYEDVAMNLTRLGLADATIRNTCRVSQLHYPFSLPEHLKADNNDSIVHFGFSNRRLEQTATFFNTNSVGMVHLDQLWLMKEYQLYQQIMRKQLKPKEDTEGIRGISNFTRRNKGMHIFIEDFTYVSYFMIVEDISLIIDHRLSQVVLGRPFVEISNMTPDLSLGIVKFANGTDEIAYKMPHKIEQFYSLADLKKEYTKSVYFRNEEDKRRGVKYVMNKILGFYKECLELGPEYLMGLEEGEVSDEGGVTYVTPSLATRLVK